MQHRRDLAEKYFLEGYNCTQAVVLAFEDVSGLDRSTLLKMASSFGGGMGRLREVCGTVSGMFLICGLVLGYDGPEKGEVKAEHYARIQELAKRFEERNSSIVCRELLGLDRKRDDPVPAERTPDFYRKRPCVRICGDAAEILETFLAEQKTI